jgi:hypothetical protein
MLGGRKVCLPLFGASLAPAQRLLLGDCFSACFWEIVRGFVVYERSGNQIAPWGK